MNYSTMKDICEVCGGNCCGKDSVCCSICDNISSHTFCMDTPLLVPESWKCEECAKATADLGKKRRGTKLIDCETARKSLVKSRSLVLKTSHTSNGNAPFSPRQKEKPLTFSVHNPQRNLKEPEPRFNEKNKGKSTVPNNPIVKFDPRAGSSKKPLAILKGNAPSSSRGSAPSSQRILMEHRTKEYSGRVQNVKPITILEEEEEEEDEGENDPPQKLLMITEGTLPHHPVPRANWKGDFQITDVTTEYRFDVLGVRAHVPGAVFHKVHGAVKELVGKDMELKFLPRYKIWPRIFQIEPPQFDDIGLYFFPSKEERTRRGFSHVVDMMDKKDFALVGSVSCDVKLLIFSTVLLPRDPYQAGVTSDICMWGVFKHRKCKGRTSSSGITALFLESTNRKSIQMLNAERQFRQRENGIYNSREVQEYEGENERPGIVFKPVILKKSCNSRNRRKSLA